MRYYKFKGKALDDNKRYGVKKGEWVVGQMVNTEMHVCIIVTPYLSSYEYDCGKEKPCIEGDKIIEVIPETVCQQTPFKDLSLQEIWEGDVFHIESSDDLGVVVFLNGCWLVEWKRLNGKPVAGDFSRLCDVKYLGNVIGNIHDNPELIKEV